MLHIGFGEPTLVCKETVLTVLVVCVTSGLLILTWMGSVDVRTVLLVCEMGGLGEAT